MTSAVSFTRLVRMERRQLAWLTVLQAVVFTLLVPLNVLMNMAAALEDQKTTWAAADSAQMLEILENCFGLDQRLDIGLALGFGVIAALGAFGYVHSREKLDFYHSLPVRRERLFAVHLTASAQTYILTYGLALAAGLLIGAVYHAFSWQVILEAGITLLRNFLFFGCSYGMALVAIMLTGKFLTTISAMAVFLGYFPLLFIVIGYFVDSFLTTCMNTEWLWVSNSRSTFRSTSPWAFCMLWGQGAEVGRQGQTGSWPSVTGICQLIAILVLLLAFALLLYRHRRSEAAGNALAFSRLEGVVKILIAIPVALVAAVFIHSMLPSVLWEAAAIVLFGVLSCLFMEFIYRWDIRQSLMHRWHIVVAVGFSLVIFFGFRFDVLGYNTYLPAQEEVASMAVRNLYTYWSYPVEKGTSGKNDEQLYLDYLESTRVDLLYPLAQDGVENERIKRRNQTDGLDDTVWIDVKYTLKNGKEIYRSYEVAYDAYCACMETMLQDADYRARMYPILTWTADRVVEISGNFIQGEIPELYSYADVQVIPETRADAPAGQSLTETETEWIPDAFAAAGLEASQTEAQENVDSSEETTTAQVVHGLDTAIPLYIEVPAQDLAAVLKAYQRDLSMLSFSEIDAASCMLYFQSREQEGVAWASDQYPISGSFRNTIRLLAKLVEEQNQK